MVGDRRLLGFVTGVPRGCFAALTSDRLLLGLFGGPGAAVDTVLLNRPGVAMTPGTRFVSDARLRCTAA